MKANSFKVIIGGKSPTSATNCSTNPKSIYLCWVVLKEATVKERKTEQIRQF